MCVLCVLLQIVFLLYYVFIHETEVLAKRFVL